MHGLAEGRYKVGFAQDEADMRAAQRLRWQAFRGEAAAGQGRDIDRFDADWRHLLIEEAETGRLVCTLRFTRLAPGDFGRSYAAQFYGLDALADYPAPMIEIGRFSMHPGCHDPDILRLAWAALTREVARSAAGLLLGCSSFSGTDPMRHRDAFALLGDRHLAPLRWRPTVKASEVFRFADISGQTRDPRAALRAMPPLLKSYLGMGGWVSDHAVIDRDLGRLHVFTGLEVASVPPGRARLLRRLAL